MIPRDQKTYTEIAREVIDSRRGTLFYALGTHKHVDFTLVSRQLRAHISQLSVNPSSWPQEDHCWRESLLRVYERALQLAQPHAVVYRHTLVVETPPGEEFTLNVPKYVNTGSLWAPLRMIDTSHPESRNLEARVDIPNKIALIGPLAPQKVLRFHEFDIRRVSVTDAIHLGQQKV